MERSGSGEDQVLRKCGMARGEASSAHLQGVLCLLSRQVLAVEEVLDDLRGALRQPCAFSNTT